MHARSALNSLLMSFVSFTIAIVLRLSSAFQGLFLTQPRFAFFSLLFHYPIKRKKLISMLRMFKHYLLKPVIIKGKCIKIYSLLQSPINILSITLIKWNNNYQLRLLKMTKIVEKKIEKLLFMFKTLFFFCN